MGSLGAPPRLLGLLLRLSAPREVVGLVSRLRRLCFAQGGLDGSLHGGLVEGPEGAEETRLMRKHRLWPKNRRCQVVVVSSPLHVAAMSA